MRPSLTNSAATTAGDEERIFLRSAALPGDASPPVVFSIESTFSCCSLHSLCSSETDRSSAPTLAPAASRSSSRATCRSATRAAFPDATALIRSSSFRPSSSSRLVSSRRRALESASWRSSASAASRSCMSACALSSLFSAASACSRWASFHSAADALKRSASSLSALTAASSDTMRAAVPDRREESSAALSSRFLVAFAWSTSMWRRRVAVAFSSVWVLSAASLASSTARSSASRSLVSSRVRMRIASASALARSASWTRRSWIHASSSFSRFASSSWVVSFRVSAVTEDALLCEADMLP
mmetsp:Transcript_44539/g.106233  ORF Transcript_44539/g.106233 Transcript_44539/m.106233 type:complete len:301 (-) Transcript_44539:400-1302(-)